MFDQSSRDCSLDFTALQAAVAAGVKVGEFDRSAVMEFGVSKSHVWPHGMILDGFLESSNMSKQYHEMGVWVFV